MSKKEVFRLKKIEDFPQKNIPDSSLLLHSCCAPCSSSVLERLTELFKITVLYYNPNIYPEAEFEKRAGEQNDFISRFKIGSNINFVKEPYDSSEFFNAVAGFENEKEGGARCLICYRLRLEKTAMLAKRQGFDYFTTTLSVSPHKNAKLINELGCELEKKYNIQFLYSDFKKNNGYLRSIELSKKYNLYRQNYCGCIYSKKD
jgi:predicted adenine nucleotide alpha hydrolase (AANH) superfamily ATPase